jgi:benzylsuccinate CoA-transferase BbsF subunit
MTKRALEGVKILEFAYLGVTPSSMRFLAVNGATVIKVESKTRPDPLRTSGPFVDGKKSLEYSAEYANVNHDKLGIALNMKQPKSIEIAKKLVDWADIVADGFTTGAMDRWGLGYDDLKKIKPDTIMMSSNSFGQTGPWASLPATGINLTGVTGFNEITGWPDRKPIALGYYTDYVIPHFILATVLAALDYKRRTGKGQHLDMAQIESGIYFNAIPAMDYAVNKRLYKRCGNRSPNSAPHGAYHCQGDNRWCAIAVSTDEEWRNFCKVIGNPAWTKEQNFATFLGRKKNEDELDKLVEEWTLQHSAQDVMSLMQAGGVAAGVVQKGEDIFKDPQLAYDQYFHWIYYPGMEQEFPVQSPVAKLSKTPAETRIPSPMMGEHGEYICTKILGMSDEEFVKLMQEGVFE